MHHVVSALRDTFVRAAQHDCLLGLQAFPQILEEQTHLSIRHVPRWVGQDNYRWQASVCPSRFVGE
jgi:hypothetical protein